MTHMLRQALVLLALVCPASSAFAESASPVELRILAINDFHGYLQPFSGGIGCPGISGPIVDIVKKLDKAVDVVISGHTHRAYVCEIDCRLVTSGDKFGTLVTAIDLKLDRTTRDVL